MNRIAAQRLSSTRALQRTAAPMGSRMVRVILSATAADDRASPVVVAELGCHAAIV
jgi:hypothetical protein